MAPIASRSVVGLVSMDGSLWLCGACVTDGVRVGVFIKPATAMFGTFVFCRILRMVYYQGGWLPIPGHITAWTPPRYIYGRLLFWFAHQCVVLQEYAVFYDRGNLDVLL